MAYKDDDFKSFKEFYPFYLSEHQNPSCKLMHFVGSFLIVILVITALLLKDYKLMYYMPLIGYGFAWIGHFVFEKNRPATFKYPFYSLFGDWVMFKDILIGKVKMQ